MTDDTVYNIKRHVYLGRHITNGKRYKERLQLTSEAPYYLTDSEWNYYGNSCLDDSFRKAAGRWSKSGRLMFSMD